jgi:enoyl-CoA hydratase/carnithine racemase
VTAEACSENGEKNVSEKTILLALERHLATITLNRPEKLNAIDAEMLESLETVIRKIDRDLNVRVVLLTGAGERAFCVGADIHAWSALEPLDMWRRWVRDGHRVFDLVARLRQPVIAVMNGFAFGGGLELALAADLRLAAEHAEMGLPEVKLGTIPGWTGSQRLPALIGPARAKELIFTGKRVDATAAERWGLVNEVVPGDRLMARAQQMATEIAANAPVSVQIAKQLVDSAGGLGTGAALEALAGALAATTEDAQEGLAAFRERRDPSFEGV